MARGLREPKDPSRRALLAPPEARRSSQPSEKPKLPDEGSPALWAIPVVVSLAAIAFGTWRTLKAPRAPDDPVPVPVDSAAAPAPAVPLPPRCVEVSAEPFMVGDAPRPQPAEPQPGASAMAPAPDPSSEPEDPGAPFAVEIGRGAAYDGGFAAGARRDAEGGAVAMVATVGADGRGGKLVRLGRSRGDLDPPVVAGAGASVLAVLIEPNASGRALKVAKVTGENVTWGPEFAEGRDDSLAVDVAASGARAAVVWDDLAAGAQPPRSNVMLALVDLATMRPVAPARPVSSPTKDSVSPRVVARPGGYWLAYLAHGEEDPKEKAKHKQGDDDPDDGESITTSWIEMAPLDDAGAPSGAPRAVTPKSGHVVAFDMASGENGNALVAYRDEDGPTGAGGGRVSSVLVHLGGGGEPHVLVDRAGTAGTPALLRGWISLASVSGATRLAGLTPSGELVDELAPEPTLGAGEPVASTGDAILWARPMGKAMRLSVVRCQPRVVGDGG